VFAVSIVVVVLAYAAFEGMSLMIDRRRPKQIPISGAKSVSSSPTPATDRYGILFTDLTSGRYRYLSWYPWDLRDLRDQDTRVPLGPRDLLTPRTLGPQVP
jgi:hypothetical protein